MKQIMNIKKNINWWWMLLAIFAFIGIIFTTLAAFVPDLHTSRRFFKTYLHFTFQANLMGFIVGILLGLDKKSIHIQRLKILAMVTLTIAGLVFWVIILPKRGINQYRSFSFVGTIIVHAITPLLAIIAFGIDCKHHNNPIKLKKHRTVMMLISYPFLWLMMAIIVYYTINYTIYSFLNFKTSPVWKIILYIGIIAIIFIGFTYLFVFLNNKYT